MAAIDLIVLGMIKAQPQSAYELQKNVEYRNISKWVKVSTPSIYKKVVQMEEKGYIRGKTVKEGKMPEKTVYQITETGEEFFLKLMEETARQPIRLFLDFNAVIMSLNLVSEQERREPVSYTHLDVYKRQVFEQVLKRFSAHSRYFSDELVDKV